MHMSMLIGEMAKRAGCAVVTIRYYEKEGLLPKPARNGGNYRLYDHSHVERLQFIRHCRELDMSLQEVRALLGLRDDQAQDCGEVDRLIESHIQQVEQRVAALLLLKQHLVSLREQCAGPRSVEACGILQGLAESRY